MQRKTLKLLSCSLALTTMLTSVPAYAADNVAAEYPRNVSINVGDTYDLDGSISNNDIHWTSWNINKVKVNQDGVVTGVRPGKVVVTSRVNLDIDKFTVNVMKPTIKVNKKTATIYAGKGTSVKTVKLKATTKGAKKDVVWSSSNDKIATVDSTGTVTAVAPGKALIYATANGESTYCEINVLENSIELNLSEMHLSTKGAGSSIKLVPTVVGSKKSVKWTTSDKKIAAVSGGKVTGKGTGEAVVTATANGVSVSCNVVVKAGNVSISEENVTMYTEESKQLKSNTGKKDTVAWSSSNAEVATVSDKGKVEALKAGEATITVSANDTSDNCYITVKDSNVVIGEDTVELKTKGVDKTRQLGVQVTGHKPAVKWTTSDKKVVTVNSKGKLTAKKAGEATITATANGVQDTVVVKVFDFNPTITISEPEYDLYTGKGNSVTLKAKIDGATKKATWGSSDSSVATVNSKGKVVAIKPGKAVITATANGVSDSCIITVHESSLVLGKDIVFAKVGETVQLPVDVVGASQSVTYKTDAPKVATIKKGVITAKGIGEATVTVKANGISEVCKVYVDDCVHDFSLVKVSKEATCLENGVETVQCSKCDRSYERAIAKVDHTWVVDNTVEATCVTEGTIINKCSVCGETTNELVPSTGHSYGDWKVITTPTKFTEGVEKRYCSVCNHEESNILPVIKHDEADHVWTETVIEPTCTEPGHTVKTCDCGETVSGNEVPALGHDWSDWNIEVPATDTTEGSRSRSCSRCEATETETIPTTEHKHEYVETTVDATCTTNGYTEHRCACGDYYVSDIPAPGHSYTEWTEVTPATEEEEGVEERHCTVCGEGVETRSIPKLEHKHNYTETVVEPTCTEPGYTEFKCDCGDTRVEEGDAALGHDYVNGKCTRCDSVSGNSVVVDDTVLGDLGVTEDSESIVIPEVIEGEDGSYSVNVIPEGAFSDMSKVTSIELPPTIERIEEGAFSNCEKLTTVTIPGNVSYVSDKAFVDCPDVTVIYNCKLSAEGAPWGAKSSVATHNYEEPVYSWSEDYSKVTATTTCADNAEHVLTEEASSTVLEEVPATCLVDGSKTHKAIFVNGALEAQTKVETVSKTGHSEEVLPAVAPTCIATGKSEGKVCSVCKTVLQEQTILDATGHAWDDGVVTKPASCTEKGVKTFSCENCEETYTEELATLEHTFVDEVVAPTCETDGYTVHSCACGYSYTDTPVEATGHVYGKWYTTVPASEQSLGEDRRDCENCDAFETRDVPKLNHTCNWVPGDIVEPTCTEGGYTVYTCKCGASKNEDVTEPLGHTYEGGFCVRCKDSLHANAQGHTYNICYPVAMLRVDDPSGMVCKGCGNRVDGIFDMDGNLIASFTQLKNTYGLTDLSNASTVLNSSSFPSEFTLVLPEGITTIPAMAFYNLKQLKSVDIPDTVTSIEYRAFSGSGLLAAHLPESLTRLAGSVFADCENLGFVSIPSKLETIPAYAFENCGVLRSINIPETVKTVEDGAFKGCTFLHTLLIYADLESVGTNAFDGVGTIVYNCSMKAEGSPWGAGNVTLSHKYSKEFTVDKEATYEEEGSKSRHCLTEGCDAKTEVTPILAKCESHSLSTVYNWSDDNESCVAVTSCANCDYSVETASVKVDEEVVTEPTCAPGVNKLTATFSGSIASTSKNVEVPAIGHYVDENSDTCESCGQRVAGLYDGYLLATFDELVNDYGLDVTVNYSGTDNSGNPSHLSYILKNNPELSAATTLVIPNGVTSIGNEAFSGCAGLKMVSLPDSVTSIGEAAFYNCYGLGVINIPSRVTEIKAYTYSYCNSLKSIDIPSNVKSIGYGAFCKCYSVTDIKLHEGLETIGTLAFGDVEVDTVTLPSTVKSAGSCSFRGSNTVNYTCGLEGAPWAATNAVVTHTYAYAKIPATCTSEGFDGVRCTSCRDIQSGSVLPIDPTAHNYVDNECQYCGDVVEGKVIATLMSNTLSTYDSSQGSCRACGSAQGQRIFDFKCSCGASHRVIGVTYCSTSGCAYSSHCASYIYGTMPEGFYDNDVAGTTVEFADCSWHN